MTMVPSLREVSHGMYGAWRFARLDPAAMAWFDRSIDGVWRSFFAAAIVYPAFIIDLALRVAPEQWIASGALRIILVSTIGYAIAWAGVPLIFISFSRWLEREEQVLGFIVAYNWCQVVQMGFYLAAELLAASGAVPPATGSLLIGAVVLATLAYEWFIARVALEIGGVAAAAIVLIDLVYGATVHQVTQSLY